jgi:hypothetical protein
MQISYVLLKIIFINTLLEQIESIFLVILLKIKELIFYFFNISEDYCFYKFLKYKK